VFLCAHCPNLTKLSHPIMHIAPVTKRPHYQVALLIRPIIHITLTAKSPHFQVELVRNLVTLRSHRVCDGRLLPSRRHWCVLVGVIKFTAIMAVITIIVAIWLMRAVRLLTHSNSKNQYIYILKRSNKQDSYIICNSCTSLNFSSYGLEP
jgi:ABC-type dipeptide/oligopeptide/nickel transport system permease subunit